jgi:RimJ/RimL family protein N-acetyltransferase
VPSGQIQTDRLTLVAATRDLARAAFDGAAALSRTLKVTVGADWPPPLVEETLLFTAQMLEAHPDQAGWWAWYFIRTEDRVLLGAGGLKGLPTKDGSVEIGYSLFPAFHGWGYATEAAGGLIEWAFAHPGVARIIAETYPELGASIRVMEKNGLRFSGPGSEDRVIRFELTREAHARRTQGRALRL